MICNNGNQSTGERNTMRRILCPECGADWPREVYAYDAALGFKQRIVEIPKVRKPPGIHITINGVDQPELPHLKCDNCGKPILDGTPAVAVTFVRGELGPWEAEYTQP